MAIKQLVLVPLLVLSLVVWCHGEGEMDGAPMQETERKALYTAIKGFVGNWWNGSYLYPDPCGWTPIEGVSCDIYDGLWYITALSFGPIHDNSLGCVTNAEFRHPLFELKHLKSLSFFNCFTSPQQPPITIPISGWESLSSNLESLEFRSNPGLTGQIPTSFRHLINLQSLVLLENRLSGELPTNIRSLTNLKKLVISGNSLNGHIPDSFGELSELLILDLSRNSLSGPLPSSFGGLASLLKLDLSNNQLDGKLPKELRSLKNMTLLDLRNNNFSGGLTNSLQKLHSLQEMLLSSNPICGDLASLEWRKLQNLVILDLSNTGLTGEVPESIADLRRLRFLSLSNNKLIGYLSPKLENMPCVSALYMNGNNLSGQLQFSESFYGKLGRRFGAWNNPNLCYRSGLVPRTHVPFEVKPCQQEVTLLQPNSKTVLGDKDLQHNSHLMASLGLSSKSIDGFWWGLLLQLLIMVLLLSFT